MGEGCVFCCNAAGEVQPQRSSAGKSMSQRWIPFLKFLQSAHLGTCAAGAELSSPHSAALAAAVRQRQLGAHAQLEGPWCDVMGSLVGMEWGRAREAVLRTGGGSVHVAVYTWMQASGGLGLPDLGFMRCMVGWL